MARARHTTRKVLYPLVPVAVLGAWGVAVRMASRRRHAEDGRLAAIAGEAGSEIDETVRELKDTLRGTSADRVERGIDKAVEKAKARLDRMAAFTKEKLHEAEEKSTK